MEEFLTFYDILDVKSNASPEKIKEAYHIMAKKYHPDIAAPENKSAYEEKFKKINEAYTVLSDEKSRKEYNKKIKTLEKEHWKKLIQDTQIQIQQLQQQLTKYQQRLHNRTNTDNTANSNTQTDDHTAQKTSGTQTENTKERQQTFIIGLKNQIYSILKNQLSLIAKQSIATAITVAAVYFITHHYKADLPDKIKYYTITACFILIFLSVYQGIIRLYATMQTILMVFHKSDKGLSFIKTNNILYCINKAASLKNGILIIFLASLTFYIFTYILDHADSLAFLPKSELIENLLDLYSDNSLTVSISILVFLCCFYAHIIFSIEMSKYTCPHCHSAFSYFYTSSYVTEDGHHYEADAYYRDYIENTITQCDICGYQTIQSLQKKDRVILN